MNVKIRHHRPRRHSRALRERDEDGAGRGTGCRGRTRRGQGVGVLQRHGAARAFGSYRELIADGGVDAVYIALTHNFHYEIARLCLESGKAVLCEKPLVLTKKDAESLAELSRRKNVLLMEAMWTRCIPAFRAAREWALGGKIGAVKLIQAAFCFQAPFDPEDGSSTPRSPGVASTTPACIHRIRRSRYPRRESGRRSGSGQHGRTGVDEYAAISLGFPSGAVASLACGVTAAVLRRLRLRRRRLYRRPRFSSSAEMRTLDPDGTSVETFERTFSRRLHLPNRAFSRSARRGQDRERPHPARRQHRVRRRLRRVRRSWGMS